MARLDLNRAPFFDDFDRSKNYMKVLFRSGAPVQARELNALQSTFQNQIESFANHIFQNGSKVSNARTNLRPIDYVRLKDNPMKRAIDDVSLEPILVEEPSIVQVGKYTEGFRLKGEVSEVTAILVKAVDNENGDPATLYVVYTGTGKDGQTTTFIPGEPISFIDSDGVENYIAQVRCPSCDNNLTEMPPLGKGMIFDIDEGIFYYEGMFIQNERQSIIVHKYFSSNAETDYIFNNRPCKIGLDMIQTIVDHIEDESLLDPSLGYPNSTAPGAYRYKVDLKLTKRAYDSSDGENFILLCRIGENFDIEYMKTDSEYSDLMDTIAQRSFETNGNYTIRPFRIRFLNHRKASVTDPLGWSTSGSNNNVVALLSPSVAYVRGYRIEKIDETPVIIPRARDTKKIRGFVTQVPERSYILLRPVAVGGSTRIFPNNNSDPGLITRTNLNLIATVGGSDQTIGTCRVNDIRLHSGSHAGGDAVYRYYITDLKMVGTNKLSQVTKAGSSNGFSAVKVGTGPFELFNANNSELVFEIPRENVKSLRDSDDSEVGSVTFTGRRKLTGTLDSSGRISFNATTGQSFLAASDRTAIWVTSTSPNTVTPIDPTSGNYITTGNTLTVDLGTGNANRSITILADVLFTSAKEKAKRLLEGTFQSTTGTTVGTWLVGSSANFQLPHADVYSFRVFWVQPVPGSPNVETDITSEYSLQTNSNDTSFMKSSIIRTKSVSTRTINASHFIRITYKYFSREAGLFYSVDSFPLSGTGETITYDQIPEISLSDKTRFSASSAIDFRYDDTDIGDIQGVLPAPESPIIFDVEYYLPRADLIQINKDGQIYVKSGVSSESPKLPKPDAEAMVLYEIWLKAYTYTLNDITHKFIENRRYTMRDIGRLENRIENLEYYTTLNLLEKSAVDMSIKDENGLDRFKNGLIADNFRNFQAADLNSPEFKAGADRELGELRPQFKSRNHKLTANRDTSSANIKWNGSVATFDYTDRVVNFNPFASKHISINPYYIFNKKGQLVLSPNNDTWTDETRLPTVTTDIDAGVEELRKLANGITLLGTDWGSWVDQNTTILGKPAEQPETRRFIGPDPTTGGLTKTWLTETVTRADGQQSEDLVPGDGGGNNGNAGGTGGSSNTQIRRGLAITVDSRTQSYTINDIVKDVRLIPYMREIDVEFYGTKLRPNTRVYAFFNNEDVTQFCRPLNILPATPGAVGLTSEDFSFGMPLLTNEKGEIIGVFRIPAGRFFVGEKIFKLSNDPSGRSDPDIETTSCEASFFAGGLDITRQDSTLNVITPIINVRDIVEEVPVDEPIVNPPPPPPPPPPGGTICDELGIPRPTDWGTGCPTCVVIRENLQNPTTGMMRVITPSLLRIDGVDVGPNGEQLSRIATELVGAAIPSELSQAGSSFVPVAGGSNRLSNGAVVPGSRTYRVPTPGELQEGVSYTFDPISGSVSVNTFIPFGQVARWRNSCIPTACEGEAPTPCSWCSELGWVRQQCWDPVAQSFRLERDAFITAIDVFFKEIDQTSNDIWVELRTMTNGYPTETVLAKKEFNLQDLVDLRDGAAVVSENATIPVHVEFEFPVFVKGQTAYCFVVGGYSPNTRIWVARLGQEDVTTPGKLIEMPPTQMPSFRSLNGSTWNAEQFETIKYNIYAAQFETGEMVIEFNQINQEDQKYNSLPPSIRQKIRTQSWQLENDPIETQGSPSSSNLVRVYARDHGFTEGDLVNISLFDNTEITYTPFGTTPPFIGQPIIFGSGGTESVALIKDIKPVFGTNNYKLTVTSTYGDFKFTSGSQLIAVQIPEIRYTPRDIFAKKRIKDLAEFGSLSSSSGSISRNAFNISTQNGSAFPTIDIGGIPNEELNKDHLVFKVDSQDSFIIQVNSTATVSGRFGGSNVAIHQFNERFDVFNVSGSYLSYGSNEGWSLQSRFYGPEESPFAAQNNQLTPEVSFIPSEDTFLQQPFKVISNDPSSLRVKATFRNNNPWISPVINTDTFSITTISNRIEWIDQSDFNTAPNATGRFIPETDPQNGTETYKYVTKNVILQDPASDLRIFFDVYRDKDADFEVYVKRQTSYDDLTLDQLQWLPVEITKNKSSVDLTDRIEYSISCQSQVNGWLDENEEPIPFIAFKVKLVGKSKNSCKPVTFRSFRAIAVT